MMTNLFCVNWASIDNSLIGLSQNGIERLFSVKEKQGTWNPKDHSQLHSLDRIFTFRSRFKKLRSQSKASTNTTEIRITIKDLDRKRYIGQALAWENVLSELFENETENVVLGLNFLLINDLQASCLHRFPVVLQQNVTEFLFSPFCRIRFKRRLEMLLFNVRFWHNYHSLFIYFNFCWQICDFLHMLFVFNNVFFFQLMLALSINIFKLIFPIKIIDRKVKLGLIKRVVANSGIIKIFSF